MAGLQVLVVVALRVLRVLVVVVLRVLVVVLHRQAATALLEVVAAMANLLTQGQVPRPDRKAARTNTRIKAAMMSPFRKMTSHSDSKQLTIKKDLPING